MFAQCYTAFLAIISRFFTNAGSTVPALNEEVLADVMRCCFDGRSKVDAIKLLRKHICVVDSRLVDAANVLKSVGIQVPPFDPSVPLGLKDSKDAVEHLWAAACYKGIDATIRELRKDEWL